MFQVIDFAQLTMDSRPSAARFILSRSKDGNDNLMRFFEARLVVQRSFYESFVKPRHPGAEKRQLERLWFISWR
jgi:hypothetical protein